jgi:hypothetical protein
MKSRRCCGTVLKGTGCLAAASFSPSITISNRAASQAAEKLNAFERYDLPRRSEHQVVCKLSQIAAGIVFGGSPLLQQGELDFSPTENRFLSKKWALALDFSGPALKRVMRVERSPAMLKRCFPLLKQRAPTQLRVGIRGFSSGSRADSEARPLHETTQATRLKKPESVSYLVANRTEK